MINRSDTTSESGFIQQYEILLVLLLITVSSYFVFARWHVDLVRVQNTLLEVHDKIDNHKVKEFKHVKQTSI